MISQAMVHTIPMAPVTANEMRQPQLRISHVTSGSDRTLPMRLPESKMLAARARSCLGNQSMLILAPDG